MNQNTVEPPGSPLPLFRHTRTQRPHHTSSPPPLEEPPAALAVLDDQAPGDGQIPASTSPLASEAATTATVLPATTTSATTSTKSATAAIKTKDLINSALLAGGFQKVQQQQQQQAGALSPPGGVCFASDMAELLEALESGSGCTIINLVTLPGDINEENDNDTPFVFENEVLVSSRVVIQGSSVVLPFLDCALSVRCFRVLADGYLELRYVRINQSDMGVLRPVNPLFEGMTPTGMVREYWGGSIYFEPGATGGRFLGVYFDDDQSDESEWILEQNLALTSFRVYGGFIFMAGGRLEFDLCLFWDFEFMTPLDRIYLGGDVLVLAGEVSFTGCVWIYTTFFGFENGAGFNIALLGGVATYTLCEVRLACSTPSSLSASCIIFVHSNFSLLSPSLPPSLPRFLLQFAEFNGFLAMNGVGQSFLVAGGVQVLTGCSLTYFNIASFFSGTGEMTVLSGAQIVVGVSLFDVYGLLASFGAGLDYCCCAGLMVHIGAAVNQFSGPFASSMVGGYSFLGSGQYVGIGSPVVTSVTTVQEAGVVSWRREGGRV